MNLRFISAAILCGLLITSVIIFRVQEKNNIIETARMAVSSRTLVAKTITESNIREFDLMIDHIYESYKHHQEMYNTFSQKFSNQIFSDEQTKNPNINTIFILDNKANIIAYKNELPEIRSHWKNTASFLYFSGAYQEKTYVSYPIVEKNKNNPKRYIPISRGIYDQNENLQAVIVILLDPEEMLSWLGEKYSKNSSNDTVLIINNEGTILARHPNNDEFAGHNVSQKLNTLIKPSEGITRSKIITTNVTLDKKQRIAAFLRSEKTGLLYITSKSHDDVLSDYNSKKIPIIIAIIIACSIICFLSYILERKKQNQDMLMAALTYREKELDHLNKDLERRINERALALRSSEAKAKALFWFAHDAIFVISENNEIIDCNNAAHKFFEVRNGKFIGLNIKSIIPNLNDKNQQEHHIVLENGKNLIIDLTLAQLPNEDQKEKLIIMRDITYKKEKMINLEKMATTDKLTGVLNRHGLSNILQETLPKPKLSALLIDADNFKRINDQYGHQTGDLVLIELAKIFQKVVRPEDIIARIGGEEFLIIIKDTEKENILKIAERIRKATEDQVIYDLSNNEIKFTISIGVATLFEDGKTIDEAITVADKRLYKAKMNGRNCIISQD